MRNLLATAALLAVASITFSQSEGPVGALRNLLDRLPPERQGNVVEQICKRGGPDDLAFIFAKCLGEDGFTTEVRTVALRGLEEAIRTRRVKPTGDLTGLSRLITGNDIPSDQRSLAIRLAGLWKVDGVQSALQELALAEQTDAPTRRATIDALTTFGGDASRTTLAKLTEKDRPQSVRYEAIAALAALDAKEAAKRAVPVLADGTEETDPAVLLDAFLDLKGGSALLAAALDDATIPTDVAKLGLRHLVRAGRSDPELTQTLSKAAGIDRTATISEAELKQLIKDVQEQGDPKRGELVFRRDSLSCYKCHALNASGGDIGPDLRGIGIDSPADYILRSILYPDEAIKEQYETIRVSTFDARLFQGIVVEEDANRLVLKDATGKRITIPVDDIDEREKGDSLMPKGLPALMTRGELVDVTAFLAQLGKPGEYAIDLKPVIRTWRVLKALPEPLRVGVPDAITFSELVLNAEASKWVPAYAMVSGHLPLSEFLPEGQQVAFLQGSIEVREPGLASLDIDPAEGVRVWLNDQLVDVGRDLKLPKGGHVLTIRVERGVTTSDRVRVELKPQSGTVLEVIGGP